MHRWTVHPVFKYGAVRNGKKKSNYDMALKLMKTFTWKQNYDNLEAILTKHVIYISELRNILSIHTDLMSWYSLNENLYFLWNFLNFIFFWLVSNTTAGASVSLSLCGADPYLRLRTELHWKPKHRMADSDLSKHVNNWTQSRLKRVAWLACSGFVWSLFCLPKWNLDTFCTTICQ